MKHIMKGLLVMVAALILCQAPQERAEAKVKVSKVTVKSNYGKMVHVAVGKKVKLTTTVKVKPNKAANRAMNPRSSRTARSKRSSGGVSSMTIRKTRKIQT